MVTANSINSQNPIEVAKGGTGRATLTTHDVVIGSGTSQVSLVSPSATSGVALISQGASADPIYGTVVPAGGGTGLTSITAHNLIIGNGTSTPSLLAPGATSGTPLISHGSSSDPVYGTAVVAGGGTGSTSFTAYGPIVGGSTSTGALSSITPSVTNGIPLISQGSGAPAIFSTAVVAGGGTGATTLTGVLVGSGTSAVTGNAITQYNVLTGGASNIPNSVTPGATSGVPLISQGASAQPIFSTAQVVGGGTGTTSNLAYGVLCGGVTSTASIQSVASVGTSGQYLRSNGAGAVPSFQSASAGSGGLVFIQSQNITVAVTQLFFTTGISSTYDNYLLVISNYKADASGTGLGLQFSSDGGATYISSGYFPTSGSIDLLSGTTGGAANINLENLTTGVNRAASYGLYVNNLLNVSTIFGYYQSAPITVNAIRLFEQGGKNINFGRFTLYGLEQS